MAHSNVCYPHCVGPLEHCLSGLGEPNQGHDVEGFKGGTNAAEEAGDGKIKDNHGYQSIPSTFHDGYRKPSRDMGGT